jgi:hypothetical protein
MWGKAVYLFLTPHWRGDEKLGNISAGLAKAQTAWCKKNSINRTWWGLWDADSAKREWYNGAAK